MSDWLIQIGPSSVIQMGFHLYSTRWTECCMVVRLKVSYLVFVCVC